MKFTINGQEDDTDNLLPCPFCAGKNLILIASERRPDHLQIKCDDCGARGSEADRFPAEAWDDRELYLGAMDKLAEFLSILPPAEENKDERTM